MSLNSNLNKLIKGQGIKNTREDATLTLTSPNKSPLISSEGLISRGGTSTDIFPVPLVATFIYFGNPL